MITRQNKPIIFSPPRSLELPNFAELWNYKDLLFFLTIRDLKVRFQQTFIGVFWIILQPLIQMLIFTAIFGVFAKIPTNGIPYSVFFLSGYVVWQLFSQIINTSGFSMVANIGVIIKSYFPRLALPLSSVLSSLIDFVIAFLLLMVFLIINHFPITWRYLLIPVLLIITTIFASGVGMLFGALMVVFRDTKNLLGFVLTIWMYVTPVMYPLSVVPEKYRPFLYLNPLTSLVETFRWIFLHSDTFPSWQNLIISLIVAIVLWFLGAVAFRSMENKIADVM